MCARFNIPDVSKLSTTRAGCLLLFAIFAGESDFTFEIDTCVLITGMRYYYFNIRTKHFAYRLFDKNEQYFRFDVTTFI